MAVLRILSNMCKLSESRYKNMLKVWTVKNTIFGFTCISRFERKKKLEQNVNIESFIENQNVYTFRFVVSES